jgi:uncharacterized membrane protein YhaH (DUF805 family)
LRRFPSSAFVRENEGGGFLNAIDWKILLWGGGRTGRKAYALAMASFIAGGWLAHAAGVAAAYAVPGLIPFIAAPILAFDALIAWMSVCLCCRRLHDAGRSGWWLVPPMVVVVACFAAAEPAYAMALGIDEIGAELIALAGVGLYLVMLAILGLLPPTPGANRFGPAAAAAP